MLLLLPVLTGLLLAASFPRFDQFYLAWIALVPLILFVHRVHSIKAAFWGGLIAGLLQNSMLLIWMQPVLTRYGGISNGLSWLAFGLLMPVLSAYLAVACLVTKFLARRIGAAAIFLFPAILVCFEYLLSISPFGGFPWLLAGYSQSRFLSLIQIADVTGVYGISFLLACVSVSLSWIFITNYRKMRAYIPLAVMVALILSCLLYGRFSLRRWREADPPYRVAILQGNIAFEDPAASSVDKFLDRYARLANQAKHSDLLILPESPTPASFDDDSKYRESLASLAKRHPLGMVFNNVRSSEKAVEVEHFNSAYLISQEGKPAGTYDQIHLVPFGEYIPLKQFLSFIDTISKDAGEYHPGQDIRIIRIGGRPANAIICFEAVFPGLARRFTLNGSELMINIVNDGWYGNTAAPYQHVQIARFRAIENRRYFLRAANTGISAVIEPNGAITAATGILKEAVCEAKFDFINYQTIYTRYGNVFIYLCAIISCGFLTFSAFKNNDRIRRIGCSKN